jgi:ubiquinone/menaquinone biosynthesis C-methylase UbiE
MNNIRNNNINLIHRGVIRLIVRLNNVFRRPGVEGRESAEAYSDWEYVWGQSLAREYLEPAGDLDGKRILDIGCGLGGKTMAYGDAGAAEVIGADVSIDHVEASRQYASTVDRPFGWGFFAGDAATLPFADGAFDTVVANDAMEHFAQPEVALREMARVVKPGGAIWLFFTPHYSPLGSHLYDYVYTPWCHLVFRRSELEGAIRVVLRSRDPGATDEEIERKIDGIMTSYDTDINHMSIRWFHRIVRGLTGLEATHEELKPAKYGVLKPLTTVPFVRELVTGTVVCRLQRIGRVDKKSGNDGGHA